MASKGKGNIFYEILIVVLAIALIATILYPSKIWEQEDESADICRTRMSTVQQFELQYIGLTNTYSDSLAGVFSMVLSDADAVAALDTTVDWENLVSQKELKTLVLNQDLPKSLYDLIETKLTNGQPLGKLAVWDSLQYKLIDQLVTKMANQDSLNTLAVDSAIVWYLVLGDDEYAYTMDFEMPARAKTKAQTELRKGVPVYETSGWEFLKTAFYDSLNQIIQQATQKDVWTKAEDEAWEKVKRASWEAEMDQFSQEERDSLWQENQRSFWEQEKVLVWKEQRKSLFKAESEEWKVNNEATWQRIISQEWETERKKQWQEDQLATLADSALTVFKTEKDSLWRTIVTDLQAEEYDKWVSGQSKHIEEIIQNLWEQERKITWEQEAYAAWLENKNSDPEAVWESLKEYLWTNNRPGFWRDEEVKLSKKANALLRLDYAILYNKLLGEDAIASLTSGLTLPDSKGLWKKMSSIKEGNVSKLARLGVVDLFRDQLLENVTVCPLAHVPHLVEVVDTTAVKSFSIKCPIVANDSTQMAISIDPVTGDTTNVGVSLTFSEKAFGGGKVANHGEIDKDGKKSWEKKGR